MKTILAATDFSRPSGQALARAAQIARAHRAELHLLHVPSHGRWSQGTGMFSAYFGDGNALSVERDRALLERRAAELAKRFRVRAECHVVPGKPAEEIAAFASAREVDLVVVSARGTGGLRLGSVGGTALKVLWNSLVPVLMVRTAVDQPYRKLLVATDLSERSRHVAEVALAMLPKASPTILYAFRGEFETALELVGAPLDSLRLYREDEREAAAARLEAHWEAIRAGSRRASRLQLVHGHPVPAVLKAAGDLDAGLVALGKHAGPRWEELVLGSVVQNLVQQLRNDVLVVA
jgi:nucleotide-binding universal stress UspA family protein